MGRPVSVNSRNVNLFAFSRTSGPYVEAFFSPGIGLWQFDSAGAWNLTAATAIDSVTAATQAASTISYRWCHAPSSQSSDPVQRRKYAWGPWYGCSVGTACETTFKALNSTDKINSAFDSSVSRYGGMQGRTCNVAGLGDGLACWYVNPALAEGSKGWTGGTYNGSASGVTPLPKPFYVVESERAGVPHLDSRRHRLRHRHHRVQAGDVQRPDVDHLDRDRRTLRLTTARGACNAPRVAQTPWGPRTANPIGNLETATGVAGGRWWRAAGPSTPTPTTRSPSTSTSTASSPRR